MVSFRQACMKWGTRPAYVDRQENGSWHDNKVFWQQTGE